jgi:hypothetical protein
MLSDLSAGLLNKVFQKSSLTHLDISNNRIVLIHLDNLLITAGFKPSLTFLGIEGNTKTYQT